MGRFITNRGTEDLGQRLGELIGYAQELKFLTAFFYFSAVDHLYRPLKERLEKGPDLRLKILVGMEVDRYAGELLEVARTGDGNWNGLRKRFLASLEEALKDRSLDRPGFPEQARFFLRLLLEGRLEIRKTKTPNHAKLYLFVAAPEHRGLLRERGVFITGSSNLTHLGLSGRDEFNVEVGDYGFEEAEEYFDDLWEDAIPLRPEEIARIRGAVEEASLAALPTPFEVYALFLKRYRDALLATPHRLPSEAFLRAKGFAPYRYQLDAVGFLLRSLEEYGGAILADVVGLGKTVMACMVGREWGGRGIVLAPPALIGKEGSYGWRDYLAQFDLRDWRVFSTGKLEEALDYLRRDGKDVELVVVDEAHRFRNPETEGYATLKAIAAGRRVLLLTATPLNNRPLDAYALLSLFVTPGQSPLGPAKDLKAAFERLGARHTALAHIARHWNSPDPAKRKKAEALYRELFGEDPPIKPDRVRKAQEEVAREVRAYLQPVTLRRNRLDLKHDPRYRDEAPPFPEVKAPEPLRYELDGEQSRFYDWVLGEVFASNGGFQGAIYQPEVLLRGEAAVNGDDLDLLFRQESQRNLADFIRRLLVRRFESSFKAFAETLNRLLQRHEEALEEAREKGVFRFEVEKEGEGLEELDEEGALEVGRRVYRREDYPTAWPRFVKAIEEDFLLLGRVFGEAARLRLTDPGRDPKLKRLEAFLRSSLEAEPRRKIVIFTEFADTAEYLNDNLQGSFLAFWPGRNPGSRKVEWVVKNFDPSLPEEEQEDAYNVLIATDKLSEGVNLNRAGTVVNYDLPWNPVRLIQRLGRVNRVGRILFPEIRVYHFVPTERGAKEADVEEVIGQKLLLIHKALGEDSRILSPEEEPTPSGLYRALKRLPEEEGLSLDTQLLAEWEWIQREHPEAARKVERLPNRVKTARRVREGEEAFGLVVFQKGRAFFGELARKGERETIPLPLEDFLPILKADPEERRAGEPSEWFWEVYERVERKVLHGRENLPFNPKSPEYRLRNALETLRQRKGILGLEEGVLDLIGRLLDDLRYWKRLPPAAIRRLLRAYPAEAEPGVEALRPFLEELERVGERYRRLLEEPGEPPKVELVMGVEGKGSEGAEAHEEG